MTLQPVTLPAIFRIPDHHRLVTDTFGYSQIVTKRPGVLLANSAGAGRESRAVTRLIPTGTDTTCMRCGEPIRFRAAQKLQQVICNVYDDEIWVRVEHYHLDCYTAEGQPHGPAAPAPDRSARPSSAK